MRLLYITSSLPFGKGEAFVIPEMAELKALGHEIFLAPLWPRGTRVHNCSRLATEVVSRGTIPNLRQLWRIWPVARDLFLKAKGQAAVKNLFAIFRALQLIPAIERYDIDHIHCHWAGCTASMAMVVSAITRVPWSITAHRWDIAANNCFSVKARSASFVRFISESGRSMAEQIGIQGLSSSVVIHMGVSLVSEDQIQKTQATERPLILCPGNLLPVKGHADLIDAMDLLRRSGLDCELQLAGDGPLRAELERRVASLGLGSNVTFLGALKHNELLDMYKQGRVSLVVLPSRDLGGGLHEGIPVSLVEAMAYRVAVVSTKTGGIPELVTPNDGILVPQADPHSLASAIRTLLSSPDLRQQFGRAGRNRVARDFSVKKTALQLTQLFQAHTAGSRSLPFLVNELDN